MGLFNNDNNARLRLAGFQEQICRRQGMEGTWMRRKPDVMWVLVLVFSLGVVTTGYTQSYFDRSAEPAISVPGATR